MDVLFFPRSISVFSTCSTLFLLLFLIFFIFFPFCAPRFLSSSSCLALILWLFLRNSWIPPFSSYFTCCRPRRWDPAAKWWKTIIYFKYIVCRKNHRNQLHISTLISRGKNHKGSFRCSNLNSENNPQESVQVIKKMLWSKVKTKNNKQANMFFCPLLSNAKH